MPRVLGRAGLGSLAVATTLLCACGGSSSTTTATAPRPAPPPNETAPHGGLAIGLTEANPNLFWRGRDVGALGPWRDRLQALRPAVYRLAVDWAQLQPTPDAAPDWTKPNDGCMRGRPPCHPSQGLRDVLAAVRSEQQAGNGFGVMVVVYGVPEWAARPAGGCERDGIGARSRPITAQGLDAYRALVRSLQELARSVGVAIEWWSPWNEPNGSFFISPQRVSCRAGAAPHSPAVYARLARAMRAELRPGQQLVIGELAGFEKAQRFGTSVAEFMDALPDDVVCGAGVFAQHQYAERDDAPDDPGAVGSLERALERRPCARAKPIWITETGVGGVHLGEARSADDPSLRADCRALHRALLRWRDDPRVDVAIQYSFRDDPLFPVGLVDATLTKTWPAYDLWRAWGGRRAPGAPAPELPASCAAG